jgi:hypothetical protein
MSKPPKKDDQNDPPPPPEGTNLMPLVAFLRQGAVKESGWHRNAERRARGLFLVTSLSIQLEPWERQLVSYTSSIRYGWQRQARYILYYIVSHTILTFAIYIVTTYRLWWKYCY